MNFRGSLPLAALLTLMGLSGSLAARTQDEAIERCRLADSAEERIVCLEAALRGVPIESDSPEPIVDEEQEPPLVVAVPPQATKDEAAPEPLPEPQPARDLGAEQVAARAAARGSAAPPVSLHASVVNAEVIHFQRLQVTLDNEQVWRQIRGDNQRINAAGVSGQSVEISASSLGGYRMRLNEMARTVRVERIR